MVPVQEEPAQMLHPIPHLRRKVVGTHGEDDWSRSIAQMLIETSDNRISVVRFWVCVLRRVGMTDDQKSKQGRPDRVAGSDSRWRAWHAGTVGVASAWSQATPCDRRDGA